MSQRPIEDTTKCWPTAPGFGSGSTMVSVADPSLRYSEWEKSRAEPLRLRGIASNSRFGASLEKPAISKTYPVILSPPVVKQFSPEKLGLDQPIPLPVTIA
jgi:hypothetical protein